MPLANANGQESSIQMLCRAAAKAPGGGHMLMEIALADRLTTLACLGLGGNVGDPAATMKSAIKALDARDDVTVEAVSSLYRTPPWGKLDQPDFINAVAAVRTSLSARSEEHTSELQSRENLVCRLLL